MGDATEVPPGLWRSLVDLADAEPTRPAVADQRGSALDRRALVEAVERATPVLARRAAEAGVGARIGVFLPNRTSWPIAQLAADRLGLGVVGLNTRFREAELAHLCREGDLRLVLAADGFLGLDTEALFAGIRFPDSGRPPNLLDESDLLGAARPAADATPEAPPLTVPPGTDREAIGFTTSGTTGFPKVAMHDLGGTLHHLAASARASGYGVETGALVALPLCGTFGWVSAFGPLLAGGHAVLHETWDPEAAARAVREHRLTSFNGADTMHAALLDALAERSDRAPVGPDDSDGSALAWTLSEGVYADFANAGAEVAARALAESEGRFRLSGVYGSSEGFALMARWHDDDPDDLRRRNGGRLVSEAMAVRAVDPADGRVLAHGEPGELQFRGPNLLARYVGNPEATDRAFDGGWFRSGDLGATLDDASFEYHARLGDSLRLRGFLCDPSEIEHHLEAHPAVELAQVVGVDRPGSGDVAVAFVRLADDGGADDAAAVDGMPETLRDWCRNGLANYKCPSLIEIVTDFPVTEGANGVKIRKVDLRARAAELLDGAATA